MNKWFLFLFLLNFNFLFSQEVKFSFAVDRSGANDNADSIIALMGITPELVSADYDEDAYYMTYKYKSNDKKSIFILYEKLPKSDFHLKGIIASFDKLFKYWKLIDPTADANVILSNDESKWVKFLSGKEKKKAHIFKEDNDWIIQVIKDF